MLVAILDHRQKTTHWRNLDTMIKQITLSTGPEVEKILQSLSVKEKKDIINEHLENKRNGNKITQNDLAIWPRNYLHLCPYQTKILRILNSTEKLNNFSNHKNQLRRQHTSRVPELEEALYWWVVEQNEKFIAINGPIVRELTSKLQEEEKKALPEDLKFTLKFSNGWIPLFQARVGLKVLRTYGESGSADTERMKKELIELQEKL